MRCIKSLVAILGLIGGLVGILHSAPIPAPIPPDDPKDLPIHIRAHNGQTYCYSPKFTKGNGYVILEDCRYAAPARYDVFQRISWKINDIWMCLSAPYTVTGIHGKATEKWDWLIVEPCAINDPNQRWIIKEDSFYTADGRFKIKDSNWYAYIGKDPKSSYDHHLVIDWMKQWSETIARPGSISLKTFIGWTFINPPQFYLYYIQNNQSFRDDMRELFYNPENGHMAQFDKANGVLYCMTSKQGKGEDWDWIAWQKCNDKIPKHKDPQYWEFFLLNDNEGALIDKDGNFLRVTQYGPHWGVPYTAKPEYLSKDTGNSPKSLFVFSFDVDRWNRYVNGNASDSLSYCPAPGEPKPKGALNLLQSTQRYPDYFKEQGGSDRAKAPSRDLLSLPPTFRLTDAWITRLWQIATTTDPNTDPSVGYCGVCLLHSYQMIAELEEYYFRGPLTRGGFFFDTAGGANPFTSFQRRYPILAQRLEHTMRRGDLPLRNGESAATRSARVYQAMALSMLSSYRVEPTPFVTDEASMRRLIEDMFRAPVGAVWIFHMVRTSAQGTGGHAQPVIRTQDGLLAIPTNTPRAALESYRRFVIEESTGRNADHLIDIISDHRRSRLVGFVATRVASHYDPDINVYFSDGDCRGEGEDRRGNRRFPSSSTVNRCSTGRCAIQ